MKAKIVAARETVEMDRAGNLLRIAIYSYTLDDLGPFEYRVLVSEDKPEKLKEAIKKKEEVLSSIERA